VIQDVAAKYNKDPIQRHLIQTILHASLIEHSQTRQLWLGMWSATNITMSTRTPYHKIIQKMT
jgi:hypothetical protein